MATVTSVSAGIADAGSAGQAGFGHLYFELGFSDGSPHKFIEAGPSNGQSGGAAGGNLVGTPYDESGNPNTAVIVTSNTAQLGQNLLDAYNNYVGQQSANPVTYSDSGGGNSPYYGNSNGFFSQTGVAAGLSQSTVDGIVSGLQSQSGLSAIGSDNTSILDHYVNADGSTPGQDNPLGGGSPFQFPLKYEGGVTTD